VKFNIPKNLELNTALLEELDWSEENFHYVMHECEKAISNVHTAKDARRVLDEIASEVSQDFGIRAANILMEIIVKSGLQNSNEEIDA